MSDKPDGAWAEHARTYNRHGGIGGLAAEIDELRAEVAFWKQRTQVEEETVGNLVAEIERLRLLGTAESISKGIAEAEVKRLRSFHDVGMYSQLQAAEAEVERLRAALALTRITAVELFRAGLVESLDAGVRLLDGPLDQT